MTGSSPVYRSEGTASDLFGGRFFVTADILRKGITVPPGTHRAREEVNTMFCWKCGKELPDGACYCIYCGTPAANTAGSGPAAGSGIAVSAGSQRNTRKRPASLSGDRLLLSGKYYYKKGKGYRRKKGDREILLSSVTGHCLLRTHRTGKAAALLLLFLVLTGGALIGGGFALRTRNALNAPVYRDRIRETEETLDWIRNDSGSEIERLDDRLRETAAETDRCQAQIEEYQSGREQELIRQISAELDLSVLFQDEFFQNAYDQYMQDLVMAFEQDALLDEWLYPYYTYSMENGTNRYICEQNHADMWFYELPGSETKFSDELTENWSAGQRGLYDRILEHGRIYITASDFMNNVMWMPEYVADNAVFAKAYGGIPDPSRMSVPGWDRSDYAQFWRGPVDEYTFGTPIWIRCDMSTEELELDWNRLVNEQAYYDAYIKFMNTIAPGLSVYDKVSYYASDDAYGGMCFDITGKEASGTEIAMLYLENHPEALDGMDPDSVQTSYDDRLAEAQRQYDAAVAEFQELENERDKKTALLDRKAEFEDLLEDLREQDDRRTADLTKILWVFCAVAAVLLLMALICLITFFRFAARPGRLMALDLDDGTGVAFGIGRRTKETVAELEERLP